jgi:hypothetical protein
MKKNLLASSLAAALGLCPLGASAAMVTFDLSTPGAFRTYHGASYTLGSGGYTLSLFNPMGNTAEFVTDSDGLYITPSSSSFDGLTGFSFSLDVPLAQVAGYSVSFVDGGLTGASFSLTNGRWDFPYALNNSLLSAGTFPMSAKYLLNAAEIGTFSAVITGSFAQLHTLTIDTNPTVPEPSTLALLLAPIAFGWSIKPRARKTALVSA